MIDPKTFGREVLVLVQDTWFIAHLGIIKADGVYLPYWTDRDGAVIVPIGEETRLEVLPSDYT